MAIRPVTYYQVVCDRPGCDYSTEDDGGDYSAYAEPSMAEESWDGEHQVIETDAQDDGPPEVDDLEPVAIVVHLCSEHEVTR